MTTNKSTAAADEENAVDAAAPAKDCDRIDINEPASTITAVALSGPNNEPDAASE